jgi:carbon monoxide dehydrogenase subunit G
VWKHLHDVDVLRRIVPGCQELEMVSPCEFMGAATVGVGPIKGLYRGTFELVEEEDFSCAQVRVRARSSHAEVNGQGEVVLEGRAGSTVLRYEGEAQISGRLAAVGQRLFPSVTQSLADTFFKNLESFMDENPEPERKEE